MTKSLSSNSSVKLSICIPTLNRGTLIGATLESIVCQATDEVEIVIVDGGSADNTSDVVLQFQKRFPGLRYIRPELKKGGVGCPSGTGFDRDCNRAVELAIGEYCWLFTDDDVLKPGAIQTVLQAANEAFELIVVNSEVRSSDLSRLLQTTKLKLSTDRIYTSKQGQEFFADAADYLSFVGAVVVKRDLWLSRNKEPYIGTGFIHVGVLFQVPIQDRVLVIAKPLITIRYGNALYMRSPRYFEIWMFIWPNLIWSFASFSDSTKRRICSREPWRRKRTLLLYRAIGAFSIREYRQWLDIRLNSRWDKVASKLIARLVGSVANAIGVAYYHLSRRPPAPFLFDLTASPYYFARPFEMSIVSRSRKKL